MPRPDRSFLWPSTSAEHCYRGRGGGCIAPAPFRVPTTCTRCADRGQSVAGARAGCSATLLPRCKLPVGCLPQSQVPPSVAYRSYYMVRRDGWAALHSCSSLAVLVSPTLVPPGRASVRLAGKLVPYHGGRRLGGRVRACSTTMRSSSHRSRSGKANNWYV